MSAIKNTKRRTANRALIFIAIGLFMMFGPMNLGWIRGIDGGFALAVFGLMFAIIFFITWIIYLKLARRQDSIVSGKNLVVHWKYTLEEWQKYTENEHKTDAQGKKFLFYLISIIALIVGIIFIIIDPKSGIFVMLVMLGVILIIALTAFLSVRYTYHQNKKHLGEAFISKDGVFLNKQLHVWGIISTHLDSVVLFSDTIPPEIEFSYTERMSNTKNSHSVRVPIPKGQEVAAIHVVEVFNNEVIKK